MVTYALSEKIHERFCKGCHGMKLPHRFRIAVGDCPNNCVKPNLNDLGGRWGKRTAMGRPLNKVFTDEEEVMEVIDRAILLFRDEGIAGERFADTVTRLGFEYVENKLLNK